MVVARTPSSLSSLFNIRIYHLKHKFPVKDNYKSISHITVTLRNYRDVIAANCDTLSLWTEFKLFWELIQVVPWPTVAELL